jgi:hypothetical protein
MAADTSVRPALARWPVIFGLTQAPAALATSVTGARVMELAGVTISARRS